MSIEEMARRGPMTPRSVRCVRWGCAIRARKRGHSQSCNCARTITRGAVHIVGFQTKMTYPEQRRVLRMIPGLARAEFVRLGSLHRNTFIDSPRLLYPTLRLRSRGDLFLAGQIIGVRATGVRRGRPVRRDQRRALIEERPLVVPPRETALGSLIAYVTDVSRKDFQPMNANYGLMPELGFRARAREKKSRWVSGRLRQSINGSRRTHGAARFGARRERPMKLGAFDVGTDPVA